MARNIITPPDFESDRSIPKVFIQNCYWTEQQINEILTVLSDKEYDIYVYNDTMDNIQWSEGIRTQARVVLDCARYTADPVEWVKRFDDEFSV
jgi:hypothetical protein